MLCRLAGYVICAARFDTNSSTAATSKYSMVSDINVTNRVVGFKFLRLYIVTRVQRYSRAGAAACLGLDPCSDNEES